MSAATPRRGGPLLAVVAALVVLLLVALGAAAPRPPVVEIVPRPTPTAAPPLLPTLPAYPSLAPPSPLFPPDDRPPLELAPWVDDVVRILAAAAALALLGWFLYRLSWAWVGGERRRAAEPAGEGTEIAQIAEEEVAEAVDDAVVALREGTAVGGAVIECWRRLERIAAGSGIPRRPSETSREFTVDVLTRTRVDAAALEGLADLYRQAMFSTHVLSDADRDRAVAALERLRSQLAGGEPP